jgi:peptidoglycan/xylan/chitin deacetylase (PgdA/CDA1 family)
VRTLRAAGFTLAAHTRTHRRLAALDEPDQRAEIEARVAGARPALAYPFGGPDAFDATTRRLARDAGYALAFALRPGAIRPGRVDRLDLPRLAVNADDTPALLRARLARAAM